MKIIPFLLFLVLTSIVHGQKYTSNNTPKDGMYKGKIVNAKTNNPLPYTKILLLKSIDSTVVSGGLSNDNGEFKIIDIPLGQYLVKITSFGFKPYFIDSVNFTSKNPVTGAGNIPLLEDVDLLNEVEVVAESAEIQTSIDKKVFNVEKQITAQGGTALDALQNVPSITIDMDGNVSLRGSANVTILIDGRPSSITGSGRSGVLETIPASSIETIEVITNPSAKYDPDGMSGIINIVLKKNKIKGFNGNIDGSIGTGINYNGSVNLAYRNEFFNVYAGYSINHYYGYRNFNQTRETWINNEYNKLIQSRDGTHLKHSNMIKLGSDFYLNKKNTIGFSVIGNSSNNNRTGDMIYLSYDSTQLIDTWQRISNNPSQRNGIDFNLFYEKKFDKKNQKLTFDGNYSIGNALSEGTFYENTLDINGLILDSNYLQQYNSTPDINSKSNIQVDYIHPLKKGKLEMGIKSTYRYVEQSFFQETLDTALNVFQEDDSLSNTFNYGEQVHAAYFIFGHEFEKIKFQIGLRAEQVFVDAKVKGDSITYNNDYFSLYPSLHIKKPLGETKELSLSYSRRVNRPRMRSINPFPKYTDPLNLRRGNPYLNPEYINSVELGYASYARKLTITTSVYYRYMTNLIKRVKVIEQNGVSATTWQNLDEGHFIGVEGVVIYKPYKWWRIMVSANAAQNFLKSNDAELNNSGFVWSANLSQTFNLKQNWTIQHTGYYMSPFILTQGRSVAMYSTDVAVRKSMLNKKLSFGLKFTDVFNTRWFAFEVNDQQSFTQQSKWKWQSRRLMFTASYKFGKQSMPKQKRQRSGGGGMDM